MPLNLESLGIPSPKGPGTSVSKAPIPQNSVQNLKSKMKSLIKHLSLLAEKKARIDFEIKKQSRALYSKRQELKKLQKSLHVKSSITYEDGVETNFQQDDKDLKKDIQILLQESDQMLKDLGL